MLDLFSDEQDDDQDAFGATITREGGMHKGLCLIGLHDRLQIVTLSYSSKRLRRRFGLSVAPLTGTGTERRGGCMRSLAPWLWLIDFDERDHALDASGSETGELTTALMAHFNNVRVLRAEADTLSGIRAVNGEGWAPASAVLGSVRTAPWANATFDCIALHDALVQRRLPTSGLLAELQSAHRLLKPGGWLALASPNTPRVRSPLARTAGIPRRVLTRLHRQASIRETRCLFVEPSVDDPSTVVPAADAAIRARDSLEGVSGTSMWKRRAALEFGAQSVLFPAYLLLARA